MWISAMTINAMMEHAVRLRERRTNLILHPLVLLVVSNCIIGTNLQAADHRVQQALVITIPLIDGSRNEKRRLHKLEDEVINAINRSRAGEYDGNEEGDSTFTMYAYGPSADKLFDVVQPILAKHRLPAGSEALKRYGDPGAREERIPLDNGTAK